MNYPQFVVGTMARIGNPLPEHSAFKGIVGKVELEVSLYGALAYSVRTPNNHLVIFYALELEPLPMVVIGNADEMPAIHRAELESRLTNYWRENPPQEKHVAPTPLEEKDEAPQKATRGEKMRATLQRQADEQGVSVSEMMRWRTAKRGLKSDTAEEPTNDKVHPFSHRRWNVGDRAITRKEISASLWEEEAILRVGTTVEIFEIRQKSVVVFDPTNPLRGVADVARGIGGWVIAMRHLDKIAASEGI